MAIRKGDKLLCTEDVNNELEWVLKRFKQL